MGIRSTPAMYGESTAAKIGGVIINVAQTVAIGLQLRCRRGRASRRNWCASQQRIGYNGDRQRESFAEMCDDPDVQRLTFDGYPTKHIEPTPWPVQMRIIKHRLSMALRGWAQQRKERRADALQLATS